MIGITRKNGSATRIAQAPAGQAPKRMIPELPEEVKKRFPALKEWADGVEKNYQALQDAHRRDRGEIADAINEIV